MDSMTKMAMKFIALNTDPETPTLVLMSRALDNAKAHLDAIHKRGGAVAVTEEIKLWLPE